MRRIMLLCVALLWLGATALAQEKPRAFVGAQIIPIAGAPIPNGTLVVHKGKIVAVGASHAVTVPADAERVDVSGKVLMPGLVDSHSHIGNPAGGDGTAPLQPETRVLDALNVRDAGIQKAQAGGITTVNVMPGSGLVSSGQTLYLKLRDGHTIDDLLLRDEQGNPLGGLKMANGTNSIRSAPMPGTRAKSAALVREMYLKAQDYREKIKRAAGNPEKMPARDLALETLVEVLDGKRVVHYHTHRHDDVLTILRLQKEFGFRVVLHHVSDGALVANEIAAAGIPVSAIVIEVPGGKIEALNASIGTGAALEKAGVLVGFHTDDSITDSRLFLRSAALAVRGGMSREKALFALTLANAKMLDMDQRVGSLEVGKDADFLVLSGDPFSTYTKVLQTFVDGAKVFDRSDPKDHLLAVGGYGASHDQVMHLDCYDDGGEHQ